MNMERKDMADEDKLKNRHRWSTTLDNKLYYALEELHQETFIPKTKLADKAVTLLLKEYGKM